MTTNKNFGRYVRLLRKRRELSQEALSDRSSLSADTIRRLEHGSFSPSMDTLNKLCSGLDINLSTLFRGYELGSEQSKRELLDLILSQHPEVQALALVTLRNLFEYLDRLTEGEFQAVS